MDLDKLLNQASSQLKSLDPITLHHFCMRNPSLRPTATVQDRECSLKFGPERRLNLNPASSEEDSEPESDFPSVSQVIEKILDTEHTIITEEPPSVQHHSPTLIICGLDPRVRPGTIRSSINSMGTHVRKVSLVEFSENPPIHSALVIFDSMVAGNSYSAKELYRKLRKYEKANVLGSKVHLIPGMIFATTVRWFTYQVLDPSLNWTAVVLRGLGLFKTSKDIQKRLGKYCLRVEIPRVINNLLCTLVVVPGVFEGKKIIAGLKNFGLADFADFHPYSSCFKNPATVLGAVYKEFSRVDYLAVVANDRDSGSDAISSISSSEEGEITTVEVVNQAPGYEFIEIPGEYITRDREICFHSGVCIKTSFNARLTNN